MKLIVFCFILFLFIACSVNTVEIKNFKQGCLQASVKLEENDVKRFKLDDQTAPKPLFTQLIKSMDGCLQFTFINNFNNSVYFYNYLTGKLIKKITWAKEGKNSIGALIGYHIKSMDSIYLYNKSTIEVILSNEKGSILKKISLRENQIKIGWTFKYPQYFPETVRPFIQTKNDLFLPGYFFGTVPEKIITDFKFTSRLDLKTSKLNFIHGYPPSLYGHGYNWEGDLFTEVYYDLHPDGDKLVYSFPVSHDLYIAGLNSEEYHRVYGGSNYCGTIRSENKKPKLRCPREEKIANIIAKDEYTAIKYDKFHKVYYRFLLKAISKSSLVNDWHEKPIAIIIMDENFNYLGETVIGSGKEWNWRNSFVTQEGLNIEYIDKDPDESYITLKVFTLKKI